MDDDDGAAAAGPGGDAAAQRPQEQVSAPDYEDTIGSSSAATPTNGISVDDNGGETTGSEDGGDTIAARTRTKFSLVDVPIDTLESFLPDVVEPILGEEQDREYQRFLSSLLPQEQENLSFLDEEDEEYEPPEDEDEDDAEVASDNAKERMTVKISKKELTELLWDSSRLGVSLSGPSGNISSSSSSSSSIGGHGQLLSAALGGFTSGPAFNNPIMGMPAFASGGMPPASMAAVNPPSASMLFPPPPPIVFPGSLRFLRPGDGTQPPQDLHGTITQEQCIQLASQMHKHVQLLLQNLHLFASSAKVNSISSTTTDATGTDNSVNVEATKRLQVQQSALDECKKMIEELQSRGERAQQCKGALLAKLNPGLVSSSSSSSQQEILGSRRVTRSLTAAHAAVAHPSMFELVGSYALDELTTKFQDNCSLQDRNSTIKEQMLEIDNHLLVTKKKNPKKPFTHSEDNLLAHGVKRFALHADSWVQIEKNFLPGKPTNVIQRRYRYLASNKTGMSAVKEYHSQFPKRRDASWILEEDLRIARGLIEFHNDNRRFARVGMNYLPHRSRLEIRKRWERLRQRFYPQVAELSPGIDDTSIDFTVLVKDLLEDKLRDQVKEQSKKLLDTELGGGSDNDSAANSKRNNSGKDSAQVKPGGTEVKQEVIGSTGAARRAESPNKSACSVKNLHPALFFTSWALINPAVLLNRTCEHNWPSFIDDMSAQPKELASSPASQLPVSEVVETENLGEAEASRAKAKAGGGTRAMNSEPYIPADAAQARGGTSSPANPANDTVPTQPASKRAKPVSPEYDSEPSTANTSALLEEDEDDDSDYEHDELVSSEDEGENASDSEEFEQLELSDEDDEEDLEDEDDDDDDESFDYEELEDSGEGEFDLDGDEEEDAENEEEEAAVRAVTPRKPPQSQRQSVSTPLAVSSTAPSATTSQSQPQQQQQQTAPPVRHPLRLRNLQKPGNERMKRLLVALERRIVGKSVHSPVGQANPVVPPAARPNGEKRRISRVSLETTQSLGPTRAYGSPIPFGGAQAQAQGQAQAQAQTWRQTRDQTRDHIRDQTQGQGQAQGIAQVPTSSVPDDHEPLVPDFDLETSEELESLSSGDDNFECEELSGGSSIEDDVDNDEDENDENALDTPDDDEDGEEDVEWLHQEARKTSGGGRRERLAASAATATHVVIQPRLKQQQQQQRAEAWTPNKKIKLLLPNDMICRRCGGKRARCGCSVML